MRKLNSFWCPALIIILLFSLSLVPLSISYSQESDSAVQAEVIIQKLTEAEGAKYWSLTRQLESLDKKALPAVTEGLQAPQAYVRLACARASYKMGRKAEGALTLIRIIQEIKSNRVKIDAAEQLAGLVKDDDGYGDKELVEGSLESLLDVTLEPEVRLSLAKALYNVSATARAVREIKELLKLKDEGIRIKAALTLAQMDHFEDSLPILKKLADDPTEYGHLARVYLEYKRLQDAYQRKVLNTRKFDYVVLDEILTLIKERYVDPEQFDLEKLMTAAAKGIAKSLDRFSDYHTELEKKRSTESINMKYGGIGAYVSMRNDYLTIERPIYGGPCYKVGLRSLDQITEVEGESTRSKNISDLINKLKGDPKTPVKIKVYRRGWAKERDFTLIRAFIQIKTARGEMLPGKIGYLLITSFGNTTAQEMEQVLKGFQKQDIQSLIIDLRSNSGGLLHTVVKMVDMVIEKNKVVVTTKDRVGVVDRYVTRRDNIIDMPIYLLVNEGTASAAEILSGALQDYKKGVLIGTQTFGKGSVQNILELKSTNRDTALRLTVAKYYLPTGRSIHMDEKGNGGLEPDIKVELPERKLWQDQESNRILDAGLLDKYITRHYDAHKDVLQKLADSDGLDQKKYPEFDDFYQELLTAHNIHLTQNEVREILRVHIRRYVADERGSEFLTDLQKDVVLQRAIVEATKGLGVVTETIPEYKIFAHKFEEEEAEEPVAK